MDWIERATGISLDGGNGSLELAVVCIAVVIACLLALGVWRASGLRLHGG